MESGIEKAIRLAGSQTALARRIGVSPQAVQKWLEQGVVPGERCRAIEAEFRGDVTRYELNQKVFGDPSDAIVKAKTRRSGADRRTMERRTVDRRAEKSSP